MRHSRWVAIATIAGWYLFALAVLIPLTDAPVVDSWLYGAAVRRFIRTGEIRFAGYTQAMPIAQVIYGAAWARGFGANSVSLEISVVLLAILCGVMFHALARRCGARPWQALAATGLLIGNPCFTFLSFSFMTEIPFLTLLVGSYLAFARASGPRAQWWLRLAALMAVIDFMIRPFGAMSILGCVGAILIYDSGMPGLRALRDRFSRLLVDSDPDRPRSRDIARLIRMLAPFAIASLACAGIWIWLTVLGPKPWDLQRDQDHFKWIFSVSVAYYLRAGVLGPALYLGTVLAPLSLLQLATRRWRSVIATGATIFAATLILMHLDGSLPATPEYSCFGGWSNSLVMRGLPSRFFWEDYWQYGFIVFASLGTAGLVVACASAMPRLRRPAAAVVIGALVYWAATIPLWFFNDRYYLLLVPAGALVIAVAPLPRLRAVKCAGFAMTLAMALMSLGGTYAYQRGLGVILATRNALERAGVPRSAIDAGYSLNGDDLYRYPKHGIETMQLEAGIPMITSQKVDEYTIASAPIPGTRVVRRLTWPGPFGLGHRYFYLLKISRPADGSAASPKSPPTAMHQH